MFFAVLPTSPPMIAVQPDSALDATMRDELLTRLGHHFMVPVALISWGADGAFCTYGAACTEAQAASEDLVWQAFALPVRNEDVPF